MKIKSYLPPVRLSLRNHMHTYCFPRSCLVKTYPAFEKRVWVLWVSGGSPWVLDWFGMGVRQPLWVFRHLQLNTILHLWSMSMPIASVTDLFHIQIDWTTNTQIS